MNDLIKTHPVWILIVGACCISFSSVFVKTSHVVPSVSAFYRVFFGSLFLIAACLLNNDFKSRGLKNNILAVICGLLFSLDLWTWHISIHYIGPGLATILANFQVFILSLVGVLFLKESFSIKFLISIPLAFLGLFLLIGLDMNQITDRYVTGIVLGLAAAFFYSLFLLLMRKLQSDRDHGSVFYYQMVLTVSCAGFLGGHILLSRESFQIPDTQTLFSLIGLGLICQCVAWVLITNALPRVAASIAGLILLLQPSLSFVWDVLFFNRQTGLYGWLGFFTVLIAIYYGMRHKQKEKILDNN